MAVKIERGGWVLIFLIGVAIVGYSLNRYGIIDIGMWLHGTDRNSVKSGEPVDSSKPLLIPAASSSSDPEVRVRVNVTIFGREVTVELEAWQVYPV